MAAAVSGSTVKGWQNGKYTVNLPTSLPVSTPLALASQNTRRGADGGWARLRGYLVFAPEKHDSFFLCCFFGLDILVVF